jgi:hypothetical protein
VLSSPGTLSRAIRRNVLLADAYERGGMAALTEAVKANPVELIA